MLTPVSARRSNASWLRSMLGCGAVISAQPITPVRPRQRPPINQYAGRGRSVRGADSARAAASLLRNTRSASSSSAPIMPAPMAASASATSGALSRAQARAIIKPKTMKKTTARNKSGLVTVRQLSHSRPRANSPSNSQSIMAGSRRAVVVARRAARDVQ